MNEQKAKELLERYNSGVLSPAEKQQLDLWYLEQARKSKLQLTEEELLDSVQQLSGRLPLVQPRTRKLWPRIAAAASIVLVLGTAVYFYAGRNKVQVEGESFANDVAPGKNGATLTLANGKKILINDALAGNIATETGVKIFKTATGEIRYEITGDNSSQIAYNTLSTTRGEQTQVRLPDGTLVFLNAESSLKYPTSFARADRRTVSLTGEGYFEVANDKAHPFIVNTTKQSVQVLGTHFNINSYNENTETKTTLIEGSVKISGLNGKNKVLKPNEQATLLPTGLIVSLVEAEYEIAWKEGFFMFNNESLESIMDKVGRWYNVKVVYEDEALKTRTFIGTINKFENISKVLRMLEKTGVAEFTVNKNVLTIKRKNN